MCLFIVAMTAAATLVTARATDDEQNLDDRVKRFLDARQDQWRDLNVPVVDGQTLHDIIVKNNTPGRSRSGRQPDIPGSGLPGRSARPAGR